MDCSGTNLGALDGQMLRLQDTKTLPPTPVDLECKNGSLILSLSFSGNKSSILSKSRLKVYLRLYILSRYFTSIIYIQCWIQIFPPGRGNLRLKESSIAPFFFFFFWIYKKSILSLWKIAGLTFEVDCAYECEYRCAAETYAGVSMFLSPLYVSFLRKDRVRNNGDIDTSVFIK